MVKIIRPRSATLIQRDMTIGLSHRAVLLGEAMFILVDLVLVALLVDKLLLFCLLCGSV